MSLLPSKQQTENKSDDDDSEKLMSRSAYSESQLNLNTPVLDSVDSAVQLTATQQIKLFDMELDLMIQIPPSDDDYCCSTPLPKSI